MEIKINIPTTIKNEDIKQKIQLYSALMMFRQKEISLEEAALLADMDNENFINECKKHDILVNEYFNNSQTNKAEEPEIKYQKSMDHTVISNKIKEYFSKNNQVLRAWLFGSFTREDFNRQSDIDIMIEVNKNKKFSLFDLSEIKYQLEKLIPFKIDIVMKNAVKKSIMERMKQDLKLIYEK